VKRLLAMFLLVAAVPSLAQTKKMPIVFTCSCDDMTGAALATAIRDQFASSPRYEETSDSKTVTYLLHIVTLDPDEPNKGYSTTYSAVITFGSRDSSEVFMGHDVGTCGRNRVSTCASDLVAYVDNTIHGR
jgi:hypothetical protein